jgi:ankyrin repeat protein
MDLKAKYYFLRQPNRTQWHANSDLFYVAGSMWNVPSQEKIEVLQELLRLNPQPDLNAPDLNQRCNTALHLAVERNELEVVKFLLSQGANPNIENYFGKTPLHFAEERNHVEIIEVLKSFIQNQQ